MFQVNTGSDNWMDFLPQMQHIFDQLNDAVYIVDQTGTILVLNKSASKMSGYESSEMIGKPVEVFFSDHPSIVHQNLNQIKTSFTELGQSAEEYPKYRTEVVTQDGHKVAVEVTHLHLSNTMQNISCIIARNISDQVFSDTLREINSTLSSSLNQDEVFDLLLVELRKLIPFNGGNFMLIEGKTAKVARTLGYDTFGADLPAYINSLRFDIESTENIKRIVVDQQPLILNDLSNDPFWHHDQANELFKGWVGAPIIIENKVRAIISLDKVEPNFFTQEHTSILRLFAIQVGSAMKNARFYSEATRLADLFMTLYQLGQNISTNLRTEDIYPSIHQAVSELMMTEFFCISLYDSSAQTITDVYMVDNGNPQVLTTRPLEKGLFATALRSGESLLYKSFDSVAAENMEVVMVGDDSTTEISQSILVVPLKIGAKCIGVISAQSYKPNQYNRADRETLELLAANVAIAIENARLFDEVQKLAITDPLTQIYNRRKLEESGNKEFERSQRYNRPLCAIMIDMDQFKLVNDTHGHLIGDQALAYLAGLCKEDLRNIDILARYGGEEFIILLPETTAIKGVQTAERLRRACEEAYMESTHGPIALTISLGVAELNKSCKTLDMLIDRADQALYESKHTGRNKTTLWTQHLKHNLHNH